jgi:hypothetical protein
METNQIIQLVLVLGYGLFIGYCAGRAHGYTKGADMAANIYRR